MSEGKACRQSGFTFKMPNTITVIKYAWSERMKKKNVLWFLNKEINRYLLPLANAIIEPITMMIKPFHTPITSITMSFSLYHSACYTEFCGIHLFDKL